MRSILYALAILLALAAPAAADSFDDASAAYDRGDYSTALRIWRPMAERGLAKAQHSLGYMYYRGQGVPRDPSPASRLDSEAFAALRRTLGEVFADAVVVPSLGLGGTDARHFHPLSADVYRVSPLHLDRHSLVLIHGTNERVAVDSLPDAVRF